MYLQTEHIAFNLSVKNGFKWTGKPGKKSFRSAGRNLVIHQPRNNEAAREVPSGL